MLRPWLLLMLVCVASVAAQWQQVEVVLHDQEDLRALGEALGGLDACGLVHTERGVSLPLGVEQVDLLRDTGFDFEVQIEDLEALFAQRLSGRNFGAYHTPDEAYAEIDALVAAHPELVGPRISIGTSLEGREIWAFRVTDNPLLDEGEPVVLINSYIHAREAITIEVVLNFVSYLVDNYGSDDRVTHLVDEREIWFLPVVNPDGVAYNLLTDPNGGGMWRKNRRNNGDGTYGVDLNRNFGYAWGYDDEGSSPYGWSNTYRGTAPFSEPATQVYRDFINDRDVAACLTYHSYSNLVIYPWDYVNEHTPDHATFNRVSHLMAEENNYLCGTAYDAVGYLTNGGTEDWLYGDSLGHEAVLCFTVEVGSYNDNFWPNENRIAPLCEENIELLLRFLEAGRCFYGTWPPAAPCITSSIPNGGGYLLSWNTPDPVLENEAVSYEARRLGSYDDLGVDELDNSDLWTGNWRLSSIYSYSSPTSLHTYAEDGGIENEWIAQQMADFEVQPGQSAECRLRCELESHREFLYCELSTDGLNWSILEGSHTSTADPYELSEGPAITGSLFWTQVSWSLEDFVGERVWLRLRQTSPGTQPEGSFIDNFSPAPVWQSVEETLFDIESPSVFVSHSEGTETGWQVRAQDADGQFGAWSVVSRASASTGLSAPELSITYGAVRSTYTLHWSAVAGASMYRVERAEHPDGPWVVQTLTSDLLWSESRDFTQTGFYRVTALSE